MLDLLTLSTSRVRTKRAASCPEHARSRSPSMQASTADMELAFENLDDALEAGFDIVDIRDTPVQAIKPSILTRLTFDEVSCAVSSISKTCVVFYDTPPGVMPWSVHRL